jgi:hypothetical protein
MRCDAKGGAERAGPVKAVEQRGASRLTKLNQRRAGERPAIIDMRGSYDCRPCAMSSNACFKRSHFENEGIQARGGGVTVTVVDRIECIIVRMRIALGALSHLLIRVIVRSDVACWMCVVGVDPLTR